MPLNPPPTDPERLDVSPAEPAKPPVETPYREAPLDPNAPLSFVPHPAPGEEPTGPVRIRTNRYGALEEHELVRLLDSMDDERSRARFRESIYISSFICIALALLILYGPHYLWHAPELINPADMMRKEELTQLNAPVILHNTPQSAPRAAQEHLDTKTIKQLQAMTREHPEPTPPPANVPKTPEPQPTAPPLLPTPQPTPRVNNAPIPEAPAPSAPNRPNFNTPNTASGSIAEAVRQSAQSRGGGGAGGNGMVQTPRGAAVGGGVQVLSDLEGVNFDDYLRRLVETTRRAWIPLLPEETEPPISKQGETYIIFTILPDGTLAPPPAMKLEASSHDVALDKAAWGSLISQGQFPPLPAKYHGPGLTLRFHFMVNKGIGQ
jgi:hypothetical protein